MALSAPDRAPRQNWRWLPLTVAIRSCHRSTTRADRRGAVQNGRVPPAPGAAATTQTGRMHADHPSGATIGRDAAPRAAPAPTRYRGGQSGEPSSAAQRPPRRFRATPPGSFRGGIGNRCQCLSGGHSLLPRVKRPCRPPSTDRPCLPTLNRARNARLSKRAKVGIPAQPWNMLM
jgi:hypothetical protein